MEQFERKIKIWQLIKKRDKQHKQIISWACWIDILKTEILLTKLKNELLLDCNQINHG